MVFNKTSKAQRDLDVAFIQSLVDDPAFGSAQRKAALDLVAKKLSEAPLDPGGGGPPNAPDEDEDPVGNDDA